MNNTATTSSKPMRIPGPEHPITIEPNRGRIVVSVAGQMIAETTDALILRESSYPPVLYVPRKGANMSLLVRSDHTTYCPYKGECSYFSIPLGGQRSTNAVWTYEFPYPAVASIREHLAFYSDRVDIIAE